jgi:hypothetical protein
VLCGNRAESYINEPLGPKRHFIVQRIGYNRFDLSGNAADSMIDWKVGIERDSSGCCYLGELAAYGQRSLAEREEQVMWDDRKPSADLPRIMRAVQVGAFGGIEQ